MKKKKEFRKFATDVIGISPPNMVLLDSSKSGPNKKNFKRKQDNSRKSLPQNPDLVLRLIKYLSKKE